MSTDAQPDRILKVVELAMRLGREHLAPYGSIKSRKDFTQPQLMACLVLRTYWKTTYRGVIEQLAVSAEVREAIGLKKLPNYSTLKKFADRPCVVCHISHPRSLGSWFHCRTPPSATSSPQNRYST